MRPGISELLGLLRGRSDQLLLDDAAWSQVLEVAEEEHILPWAAHLASAQASITPEIRGKLKTIEREAAIAAFYWTSELVRILAAFARSKVLVVPLKGPSLGERLYGDAALRVNYDLDILVRKCDLAQAEALLSELGFNPGIPDDYHRQWYRGPTTVELHHDVENPLAFHFDTAAALARAQPALFHGQPCWQLTPGDELVFLCLHAVRHRFERLSLVLDLCLAFEKLSAQQLPKGSQPCRERSKLLAIGLAMARQLRKETTPQSPIHASPAQTRHLEALAQRLWDQLTAERSQPLDWRAVHAFYLDMELPGDRIVRQFRHLRILMARVIAPDYEFAASFGLRRAWQARLLRPLRLISGALRQSMPFEGEAYSE